MKHYRTLYLALTYSLSFYALEAAISQMEFDHAVITGELGIVKKFLAQEASSPDAQKIKDYALNTAVWAADEFADTKDVVAYLIGQGANINAPIDPPALIRAVEKGNKKIALYLLELPDIDVNIRDKNKRTALHAIVDKILTNNNPAKKPELLIILVYLIAHGANRMLKNKFGDTPLHRALTGSKNGAARAAELLLTYIVDDFNAQNEQDAQGNTPLHLAVAHKNKLLVKILLSLGAKRDIKNLNNHTALELAQQLAQDQPGPETELIKYLLEAAEPKQEENLLGTLILNLSALAR